MIKASPVYFVSEIFESIQGEGNFAGVYSLFIRFQHCNLACSWCDSKYTWHKNDSLIPQSVGELKEIIQASKAQHIIFTGGEPTLYPLDKLVVKGKKFHVETNGTIIPTEPLHLTLSDGTHIERAAMKESAIKQFNWVISPKLSNAITDIQTGFLAYWASKEWGIFKFIIKDSNDITEIEQVVEQYNINKTQVYIAIEGCTLQSQLRPKLVDELVTRGFNYSPRLHVILWGAKRKK